MRITSYLLVLILFISIISVLSISKLNAQTTAVAYKTTSVPTFNRDNNPANCYNWSWGIEFFVTKQSGLNPASDINNNFIVQHIESEKKIFLCDGNPDPNSPRPVDEWEMFILENGKDKDINAEGFLENRRTTIKTKLSAGYQMNVEGVNIRPTPGNPIGSDAILSGQPNGFSATLIREYEFEVNCCPAAAVDETFSGEWKASNSFGTYDETWRQIGQGSRTETNSRVKNVDGRRVP
jgi:hypothetical protein